MKKCFILLIVAFIASQIVIYSKEITVSIGANYTNQVFYSLADDAMVTVPKDNWDIAFETGTNAGILLNSTKGNGMVLYYYPQSNEDSWDVSLDTTGMSATWEKWYDSEATWSVGAFNRGKNGFENEGDFGWGVYNMGTHVTLGNSLYVLKMDDGTFKKIMISDLLSGVYTFLIADIDGSNKKEYKVSKKDYGTKNFVYFDLKTGQVIDREPVKGAWDLLFTKYTSVLNMGGTITPYSVTGVKSNKGVFVAQEGDYLIEQAPVPSNEAYTDSLTAIGSDWKKYVLSENKYDINDMMIYFVAALDGFIYKIAFRDFGGMENGNFIFEKQDLQTSVDEYNGIISSFAVYPNVAATGQPVSLVLNKTNNEDISINVYNLNGTLVTGRTISHSGGMGVYSFETGNLAAGVYYIKLFSDGAYQVQQLIIQ